MQKELYHQYESKLHEQILKVCHRIELSLHDNHKGPKIYTNYQRVAILVLYIKSGEGLRNFVKSLYDSRWPIWLGLKEIPSKSSVDEWMKKFDLTFIRKLLRESVKEYKPKVMAIDATGIDSWRRSRHYERRIKQAGFREDYMPYAKADILVDTNNKLIYDHNLRLKPRHDVLGAESIFKRVKIKNVLVLGDKGYDSEPLHEIAKLNGINLYAPVRNSQRNSPRGKYRKICAKKPPINKGMRSIVESVIRSLKVRINSLRSRLPYMKKREFAWHILLYNLNVFVPLLKLLNFLLFIPN